MKHVTKAGADKMVAPPEFRLKFGKRLQAARLAAGFATVRSFAERLGVDEIRYWRYERGETEPHFELLVKLCAVLKVTPNELLGVDGDGGKADDGET